MDQPRCFRSREEQSENQQIRQDMLMSHVVNRCYPAVEITEMVPTGEMCDSDCPACHGKAEAVEPVEFVRETFPN